MNRWYHMLVIVFWLATMSWLVVAKILPPLLVGEPPSYREIVRHREDGPPGPVAWNLFWNSREVGWARNDTVSRGEGMFELRSQVRFRELPWDEISPFRLGAFADLAGAGDDRLSLDAVNSLLVDALGRPQDFRSTVKLGIFPEAIRMQGRVEGNQLLLTVRIGQFSYPTKLYLPNDAILGDILSPQPRLPHLRVGQSWTVPVYSPFAAPNQPMQVLKASVEREETIVWNGQGVRTRLVVYRGDAGAGLGRSQAIQGKAWVMADGNVIRQEAKLMHHVLRFEQIPPGMPLPPTMPKQPDDGWELGAGPIVPKLLPAPVTEEESTP